MPDKNCHLRRQWWSGTCSDRNAIMMINVLTTRMSPDEIINHWTTAATIKDLINMPVCKIHSLRVTDKLHSDLKIQVVLHLTELPQILRNKSSWHLPYEMPKPGNQETSTAPLEVIFIGTNSASPLLVDRSTHKLVIFCFCYNIQQVIIPLLGYYWSTLECLINSKLLVTKFRVMTE